MESRDFLLFSFVRLTRAFHCSLVRGTVELLPFQAGEITFCNSGLTVVGVGILRAGTVRTDVGCAAFMPIDAVSDKIRLITGEGAMKCGFMRRAPFGKTAWLSII